MRGPHAPHLVAVQHRFDDAAEEGRGASLAQPHAAQLQVVQRAAGAQLLHQEDVALRLVHVLRKVDIKLTYKGPRPSVNRCVARVAQLQPRADPPRPAHSLSRWPH